VDPHHFRYHHLGIPTNERRADEAFLPRFKMYVSGYGSNDFNIEWMRFEPGCTLPKIIQELPHVAFEVDDLRQALVGRMILIEPNSPSPGTLVAFIIENGAPVELIQSAAQQKKATGGVAGAQEDRT